MERLRVDGRGGARKNAGRKQKGSVAMTIRVTPEEAEKIREFAKKNNATIAESVAAVLAK